MCAILQVAPLVQLVQFGFVSLSSSFLELVQVFFEPVQVFYNRYKFQMLILLHIVLSYFSNATIFEVVRVMFFLSLVIKVSSGLNI